MGSSGAACTTDSPPLKRERQIGYYCFIYFLTAFLLRLIRGQLPLILPAHFLEEA